MSELDELTNKNNWKTEETFGKYGAVHVDVFTGIVDISDAAEELAALRAQLAEANEIISMVDAAVHRDDVESVKSLAYEYVNKYGVQA